MNEYHDDQWIDEHAGTDKKNEGAQYEYSTLILAGQDLDHLNELGREGWELVSVTSPTEDEFAKAYFKRRI